MDHYLDIKVIPDNDFNAQMLLNILFGKLHLALVNLGDENVGVSFPAFCEDSNCLGDRLRIHSTEKVLQQLATEKKWMRGVHDYTALSPVRSVPDSAKFRTVSRFQIKSNPEKERRRLIKRKNITREEALKRIPDSTAKMTKLPYLEMKSLSKAQRFKLFIKHSDVSDKKVEGQFSKYGLSGTATIPWF
ncbi:type I-F CRISPR-associated endoribonuclease Cas6/Csy4 [Maridesulfovibrio hydrothermalis]|uniref:CRISPR-associated protein family protein n=1 Tax=Maridesulfovibrio hydrothermalis AM13 = DSM 14728 TaxID=1121451 RepID=L0RE16_9BACT|nr:type I-F CRISPR-associated endoribonuclease Cas6/Csy4 [Maridesulfovibrio hydrothermalis]CCO24442.1 CRISPR-associated protein family protein [Maridesulfovibrio hydrothermalis AM13 = DSM 14728]